MFRRRESRGHGDGRAHGPSDAKPVGQPDASYLRPYRDAVEAAGPVFEALLWHSRAYQQVRFKVMTDAIRGVIAAGHASRRPALDGRVVVDLGCGRGDYAAYLASEGIQIARYIGVEAVPELAVAARKTVAGLRGQDAESDAEADEALDATIIEADFAADPVLIERLAAGGGEVFTLSGSLNTMDEGLARAVLERAWRGVSRVRRGVLAFNFLSSAYEGGLGSVATPARTGPDFGGPARRFDTLAMIEWALTRSTSVAIRHDYLGGRDATIVMGAEA
ncbi:MAG: class I SAM-dependent methyltransferase [Phycisphaerales bacterium]